MQILHYGVIIACIGAMINDPKRVSPQVYHTLLLAEVTIPLPQAS